MAGGKGGLELRLAHRAVVVDFVSLGEYFPDCGKYVPGLCIDDVAIGEGALPDVLRTVGHIGSEGAEAVGLLLLGIVPGLEKVALEVGEHILVGKGVEEHSLVKLHCLLHILAQAAESDEAAVVAGAEGIAASELIHPGGEVLP